METEGSLPHSQVPATSPCPYPARSSPYPTSHFLKIHLGHICIYRVSIKSFPDYEHLLQANYCTWNTNIFFFQNVTQEVFLQHISTLQHVLLFLHGERLIDSQFLSMCSPTCLHLCLYSTQFSCNVCNQEKTLCSPCVYIRVHTRKSV